MSDLTPSETTNLDRYGNGPRAARCRDRRAVAGRRRLLHQQPGHPQVARLGRQPRCTISAHLPGIDLVLDGTAERVTGPETLERVASGYRNGGWPAQVEGDALTAPFSAPNTEPPQWHIYRLAFHPVVGVATAEPNGATRWRFQR